MASFFLRPAHTHTPSRLSSRTHGLLISLPPASTTKSLSRSRGGGDDDDDDDDDAVFMLSSSSSVSFPPTPAPLIPLNTVDQSRQITPPPHLHSVLVHKTQGPRSIITTFQRRLHAPHSSFTASSSKKKNPYFTSGITKLPNEADTRVIRRT